MKTAYKKDEALLAEIRQEPDSGGGFRLWWLGQSGFLLQWQGRRLLLDPYLSDSLTRKYAATDKPHVRMTERVIDPALLTGIDLITSSHAHTDHLDAETLLSLRAKNAEAPLILPSANIALAQERLSSNLPKFLGLDAGETVEAHGFRVTGIPAAHEKLDKDPQGRCLYLGFVVQFGEWTIYHSGDTVWHDGLVESLRPPRPDLMLLPINGSRPERRVAGNLNGAEAAALAKACNASLVIPCHYDMFAFNTESPELFEETCRHLKQPYRVLQQGECLSW